MAPPPEAPPQDAEASLREALARARRHARNAVAEALETLRALLDAASLGATGVRAEQHPLFAASARRIREWSHLLAEEGQLGSDLGAALADALEGEIARWEARARDDADARAVLRAFLGLRELLWELGVRPANGSSPSDREGGEAEAAGARSPGPEPSAGGAAPEGEGAPEGEPERPARRARRVPVES